MHTVLSATVSAFPRATFYQTYSSFPFYSNEPIILTTFKLFKTDVKERQAFFQTRGLRGASQLLYQTGGQTDIELCRGSFTPRICSQFSYKYNVSQDQNSCLYLGHMTLRPPSTGSVCPVMKEAPLPARNSMALATLDKTKKKWRRFDVGLMKIKKNIDVEIIW